MTDDYGDSWASLGEMWTPRTTVRCGVDGAPVASTRHRSRALITMLRPSTIALGPARAAYTPPRVAHPHAQRSWRLCGCLAATSRGGSGRWPRWRICPVRSLDAIMDSITTPVNTVRRPPFWADHFTLAESGLRCVGGRSERSQTGDFRCPQAEAAGVCELIDPLSSRPTIASRRMRLQLRGGRWTHNKTARSDLPVGRGDQPKA